MSTIYTGNKKMHKHRDLIIAWANGAEIEWRSPLDEGGFTPWIEFSGKQAWYEHREYRIKPKPVTEPRKVTMYIYNNAHMGTTWIDDVHPKQRVDSIYSRYMGSIEVLK